MLPMWLTTLYGPCLFVCSLDVFCVSYCTNTYELIGKFVVYGLFFDRSAITYISCSSWFFWAICMIRSWAAISFLTCSWTDLSPLVGPGAVRKCRSWLTEFPKIISVGDTPVLVLTWVFKIHWTYGRYFGQFDLRSWSEIIAVRCRITSWFARSTIPFSSWLYGCIVLWSRHYYCQLSTSISPLRQTSPLCMFERKCCEYLGRKRSIDHIKRRSDQQHLQREHLQQTTVTPLTQDLLHTSSTRN